MKTFALATLLLLSGAALAQESVDARVAELEARIRSLEAQIQRLTASLEAATSTRPVAAPQSPVVRTGPQSTDAPSANAVQQPPPTIVVVQPPRQESPVEACMRQQTYALATGESSTLAFHLC